MKTIKKILTGFITACMVLSAGSITAFAAEADISNSNSLGSSLVQYAMNSGWAASIPAFITPSVQDEVNTNQYSVDVSDIVLGNTEKLVTTIEYDGKLVEANGVEIPYTLYDANGEVTTGNEIISTDSGNPNAVASYSFGAALNQKAKYAGTYTGTATFNFTAEEKIYTAEEIENDAHLFGIGATKSEYVISKFNDDFTEVTIFSNGKDSDGEMMSFQSRQSPMRAYNSTLKKAIIESKVHSVSNNSFYGCASLTDLIISSGVNSIDDYAFSNCTSLEDIAISDGLTSIGENAFGSCTSLRNLTIPNSVTSIGNGAFWDCSSLNTIILSRNMKTINARTFYSCTSLENIEIPVGITSISSEAFFNCTALKNIELPNSITAIGDNAFSSTGLTEIVIPDGVTAIERRTFYDCPSLRRIELPNSVTSIGELAFYSCKSLSEVNVPNSVTTIGNEAFSGCSSLTNITIPDNVTSIGSKTFSACLALSEITIGSGTSNIANNAFYKCSNIQTISGHSGTYAETWANSNGYTFVAID